MVSIKKPDFETFRELFFGCLPRQAGQDDSAWSQTKWAEVGGYEDRREVMEAVKDKVQEIYGIGFDVNHRLLTVDGPVESAVIQAYHEFNTIFLMEKINAKIRARLN